MSANKNIYQLFRPFFFIVKSLGLACYTLESKTKSLKATQCDKFLFVLASSLWSVTAWIQVTRVYHVDYDNGIESEIIDSVWYYQYNITHFFGLGLVIFSFKTRIIVEKILKIFFDIDAKLKSLGWQFRSQNRFFYVVLLSYIACAIGTTTFAVTYAIHEEWLLKQSVTSIAFNIFESCCILLFYLVVAQQLIICAFYVQTRLKAISINLR